MATFEAADASLGTPPADAGLFTDAGSALDPASVAGLAGRIAVNDLVTPTAGGDLWRLQSGIPTAAPLGSSERTQAACCLAPFDTALPFDPSPGFATHTPFQALPNSLQSI